MLNCIISISQNLFMALLCFVAAQFIFCCSLTWLVLNRIDLLVMAWGAFGDCHFYQMYPNISCALLRYCALVYAFILYPHCGVLFVL